MSCDIDDHITAKYDIKKRIGKGVSMCVRAYVSKCMCTLSCQRTLMLTGFWYNKCTV